MMANAPRVLALSYYDGATEGFLDGIADDNQVYYFKVVAWDREQDERLYLLGSVERAGYAELLALLEVTQRPQGGPTWLPEWNFSTSEGEAQARAIVDLSKLSMGKSGYLALGSDPSSAVKILNVRPDCLARAMDLADRDSPGDLADWLAQCA